MILNCPQCASRFLVADRLIPVEGRTVRCGACSHEWHVYNQQAEPVVDFQQALQEETSSISVEDPFDFSEAPDTQSIPQPAHNVPALKKRHLPMRPFKLAVPALAALWAILAVFTYYPRWTEAPVIGTFYRMIGVEPTTGLAFADVKMQRELTDTEKTRFVLTGRIVNHSAKIRTVPEVKVELKDKNAKAVWARSYPVKITLEPGESYPFHIANAETRLADSVSTITLDLGNAFQLMNR